MPFYELALVLRPMPKTEVIDCLKRTAKIVWDQNGALRKIEFLGQKKLPFKIPTQEEGQHYTEGSYFLYHVSINPMKLDLIRPELRLDLDIIRSTWNLQSKSELPDDYQCTISEESAIPFFRPHIQALLYNKNVRVANTKIPR